MAALRFALELNLQTPSAHDKLRKRAHVSAKEARKPLIKNGKFFVAPHYAEGNFKQVFARLTASGAGRPVDPQGFPDGPWTPEELADAISTMEANSSGVELRAVQGWFQDNYNGISDANIRWLARIFGCNDPEATSQWQAKLRASKVQLTKERRAMREQKLALSTLALSTKDQRNTSSSGRARLLETPVAKGPHTTVDTEPLRNRATEQSPTPHTDAIKSRSGIAKWTEAIFAKENSLTLPLAVFTGACTLTLIAYSLSIHSVTYAQGEGFERQVGFLWAPNWTIVFMVILPVFLSLLIDLMHCWSTELRPTLASLLHRNSSIRSWDLSLSKASHSFWITFFVTVLIASFYNWFVTHFLPLLKGDPGGWPMDWGRIAIVQPERVSVLAAIAFSGLVFLYNGFTAYLFFAGLVFIHLMKNDFTVIVRSVDINVQHQRTETIIHAGERLMHGVFRCTALGMTITLMMKLQSAFLQSGATSILDWLMADVSRFIGQPSVVSSVAEADIAAPGHIYSFLCVVAIVGTYLSAQLSIRYNLSRFRDVTDRAQASPWVTMNICMAFLVVSYFAIGFLPGFTLLVLLSLLIVGYLVSQPDKQEASVIA